MKCSVCGEDAVSLVASVIRHHDFEVIRYDARCKKHNQTGEVELRHFSLKKE